MNPPGVSSENHSELPSGSSGVPYRDLPRVFLCGNPSNVPCGNPAKVPSRNTAIVLLRVPCGLPSGLMGFLQCY